MNGGAPATAPVPSLRDLQLLIWRLLVAPEGAGDGLQALLASRALAPGDLESWITGDEKLSALGRVDIYADMYFFRLKESLLADFPKVAHVLGRDDWHLLVGAYLLDEPSRHWSLRYIGRRLPGFLKSDPRGEAVPWLADLAALEFARADVFQAEDAPVLSREALAGVPHEQFGDLVFQPVPALARIEASWDVAGAFEVLQGIEDEAGGWETADDEGPGIDLANVPEHRQVLLVFRDSALEVRHEVLFAEGDLAVKALLEGRSFGTICEALARDGDLEAAARRASDLLRDWLDRRLLTAFRLAGV